jgi:predicted DNA-binding WGR domain protein
MTNVLKTITLERRQPELNMARFYVLDIEHDLFGTIVTKRTWGRIGTYGRTLTTPFASMEVAMLELARLERAKRRRGYRERTDG